MPPKFEVRDALRTLERAGLENKLPVWDDGRMIVEEGHIALRADEMTFATRRYRAPYGLEQVEMRQEGKELDAAGPLYVALTEYKIDSEGFLRGEKENWERRAWMRLSVKQERIWRWETHRNRSHQRKSSPRKSC